MVGIILATHGEFAKGILQSGSMIFGEQENAAATYIMPNDGPEELYAKMEEAIASFEDTEEILFLVDLWGGTPFNQAIQLVEAKPETRAIVTGLNLPMLIEAYASRFTMETAHEIAQHIVTTAIEGVKTSPESLMPAEAVVVAQDDESSKEPAQPTGPLPEGTVVGDGEIDVVLARIDSRLLHGQVATGWTRATNPNRIIVVSDRVSQDDLRKKLIEQAAPSGVKANVVPVWKMAEVMSDPRFGNTRALLLFETPQDVLELLDAGGELDVVNVGSMAHSVGKVQVNNVLSMDQDDVDTFAELSKRGIKFDVRRVPGDSRVNMDNLIKRAEERLK